MPENSRQRKEYTPMVLVDTAELSEEEWLAYRRKGIGGSDVASVLGISPFRTARDLYYDKRGIVSVDDDKGNWVAMEMGHLLEDLVAKIFQKKTGFQIYQLKKMFYHPHYPFMLADLDYLVVLPDGTRAILEIKTTNYNAKDHWWMGEKEIVPVYYETQGRHYMAVMNIDRVFFCCLYGNNEDEVIIRELKRDLIYEEEMIFLEQDFWNSHVLAEVPPPYTEDGDLIMKSVKKYTILSDQEGAEVAFNLGMTSKLMRYLQLQEEKKSAEAHKKKIEQEQNRLKAMLIAEMGFNSSGVCRQAGHTYRITYNPVRTANIDKDNMLRFKLLYPEIYEQFVTVTESRRFRVNAMADEEAA